MAVHLKIIVEKYYLFLKNVLHVSACTAAIRFIHSFSSLSYDRSKASSKASSPHSAIQSFLLQMKVLLVVVGPVGPTTNNSTAATTTLQR